MATNPGSTKARPIRQQCPICHRRTQQMTSSAVNVRAPCGRSAVHRQKIKIALSLGSEQKKPICSIQRAPCEILNLRGWVAGPAHCTQQHCYGRPPRTVADGPPAGDRGGRHATATSACSCLMKKVTKELMLFVGKDLRSRQLIKTL
jgi:hypothetical protein